MNRSQFVAGTSFITLGTVLLLDQADVVDASQIVSRWWPIVVIVLGLTHFVMRPRNPAGGTFLTAVGIALLLWSVWGVGSLSLVWPLLLVGVGLWLLTRRSITDHDRHVVTDPDVVALFDDQVVRAERGPLGQRSVTTILGDVELDLGDATIDGRTTVQIVTIFGDVQLDIPDTWHVSISGPRIFGDVTVDPPAGGALGDATLHLDLVTIFGDVTVRRRALRHGQMT